jgi:UrcA family protein
VFTNNCDETNLTRREKPMTSIMSKISDYRHVSATLTALTVCLVAGAAGAAHAATPARSVTVSYGDLNLASAQGTDALYARIVSAAREVCGAGEVDIRNLHALASERTCESSAIAQAVHAVHSPALAALYGTRQPQG